MCSTRPRPRPNPFGRGVPLAAVMACIAALSMPAAARAQLGGIGGFGQAVGGISIDAAGIVRNVEGGAVEALARERREALARLGEPAGPGAFRKVSLARIAAAASAAAKDGTTLPADVLLLGGLERVTHVFVDPDGHDIVLGGPADLPTIDAAGNIVGTRSGRPLLQLEDLVVALRSIDAARDGGMRCSIDPAPAGLAKLRAFLATRESMGPNPDAVLRGMEAALGPQAVTVGGVPADSRFARVLVAADYRMKRIGIALEPSGIPELPSYLALVPPGAKASSLPRFWLEAEYEPLARDPDELAWRIGGRRMKCLTESDLLANGAVQRGRAPVDAVAQAWCGRMTEHYEKLAARQPVFAELVNVVDAAVVAALIRGRQLDRRAGCDLGPLLDAERLPLPTYAVPATVPAVASGLKKGGNWVLSASGGVQFQPWEFIQDPVAEAKEAETRTRSLATRPADARWWD